MAAHVISDSLIGVSYLAISITLAYLVTRMTLWQPLFSTSADLKIVTAVASAAQV
jgi:hypothetical protein